MLQRSGPKGRTFLSRQKILCRDPQTRPVRTTGLGARASASARKSDSVAHMTAQLACDKVHDRCPTCVNASTTGVTRTLSR